MSVGHCCATEAPTTPFVPLSPPGSQRLQRLGVVRRRQGVARRAVARVLNVDVEQVRRQESETCDLPLSTLYAWQKALEVPIAELLVEPDDGVPSTILMRSRLVRLMKTVQAISEKTKQESVRRMTETMVGQLVELMPELAEVGAWNIHGRKRRRTELGMAAQRRLADDMFVDPDDGGNSRLYASFVGEGTYAASAALETA